MNYKGVQDKIILCKVTSRERPEQLINCVKTYLDNSANPTALKWLFSFDSNDLAYNNLGFTDTIKHLTRGKVVFGESFNKIHAINRDINEYSEDWHILINISDDQFCTKKDWDNLIRETMPNDLDASLWFFDGWQGRINTQEIVGKNYYNRFNYIYYPEYKSFFCDNESTEVAEILGKLIKNNNSIVKHYHPACDRTVKTDDLYQRQNINWNHDQSIYQSRKVNNYGL